MVDEHPAISAITEKGSSKVSHGLGGSNPILRFHIKNPDSLEASILLLIQQFYSHSCSQAARTAARGVLFSFLKGNFVIAETSATKRTLGRAIDEHVCVCNFIVTDYIRLSAGALHL